MAWYGDFTVGFREMMVCCSRFVVVTYKNWAKKINIRILYGGLVFFLRIHYPNTTNKEIIMYLADVGFNFRSSGGNYSAQSSRSHVSTSGSTHTRLATSIEYRRALSDLLRLRNRNVLMSMACVLLPYPECHLRTMTVDALAAMVRSSIADCCELSRLSKAFAAAVACVPRADIGLLSFDTQVLLRHRPSLNVSERSLSSGFPRSSHLDGSLQVSQQGFFGSAAHARQPFSTENSVEEPKAKPNGPSLRMGGLSL